jgi:hypothetical protein
VRHGPGTIAIPVSDGLRYPEFFTDYCNLVVPEGTKASMHRSASVVSNLNMSLRDMPDDHEWAWIMGDDHVFGPNILMSLLDHDADVIVPLCAKRTPPFGLVIMREEVEYYDENMKRAYPGYIPYEPHEVPGEVFPVVAAGSAGMLVRRHVIDDVGFPWFESSDGVYLNEDFEFCRKVREAGYEILCDPHLVIGHIGQMHIWPHYKDGQLMVMLDCGGPPGQNEVFIGPPVGQQVPA